MINSSRLESERKSLVDFMRSCSDGMKGHLDYVVNYLRGNEKRLKTILVHAEGLLNPHGNSRTYENPETLIQRLTNSEIPLVQTHLYALNHYLNGQSFEGVRETARALCFSRPVPATVRAPPGTFSPALIYAYRIV